MQQKTLISIIGPTAIGKTKLAIKMAQHYQTEIISCDSRQFFREMPIGTAAPTAEELSEAPHHFIGHRSVAENYSIGQYEVDALAKLSELFESHSVVVMVGGSGMYEKAVVEGLNTLPEANAEHQHRLEHLLKTEGIEALQNLLSTLDPAYYQTVDFHNPRRLLRAIDIIWQTGEPYSKIIAKKPPQRDFKTFRVQLSAPREVVYQRINQRVEHMITQGLLEEVRALEPLQHLVALQTVGYRELFQYLNGTWDWDFAISEIKKNSRRYAKRQLTWNRKLAIDAELPYLYSDKNLLSLLQSIR